MRICEETPKTEYHRPARLYTLPVRRPRAAPQPVGLGRAELAAEMAAFGAEPFRARQLWHWIYHRGVTDFAAMTNLAKDFRAQLAERYVLRRPEVATRADLARRHAQMAAALRRRPGGRDRPHPRGGSRHAVRLLAGRLHPHLHVLPYRHAAPGAQPRRRPRSSARSCWRATRSANGRRRQDGPAAHQHRADGHGRAALQFRQCRGGDEDRHGPRGAGDLAAQDHAVDRRAWCR